MTTENDESRLSAALEDGHEDDHPDSARQHEPRSRGRNRQHGPVDLDRTIGGTSARRVGVFEWMRAVRDAPVDVLPRRVKGTLLVLATFADVDGSGAFPGMERLGESVGKAADNVGRDLKLAVDRDYLSRSRSNRQQTYRYRLTVPADSTEASGRTRDDSKEPQLQPDPTESSDRDPTESSGYLPSTPAQTKTPSASSSTTPTTDVSPDPASDVEREALAAADPTTNGDAVYHDEPDAEDAALKETLGTLTDDLRREALATWHRPGGPEILRYVVDAATDLDGPLDVARVARLLDSPWEAFRVGSLDGRSGYAIVQSYSEAVAEFERRALDGETATLEGLKGQEAELALAAAATPHQADF